MPLGSFATSGDTVVTTLQWSGLGEYLGGLNRIAAGWAQVERAQDKMGASASRMLTVGYGLTAGITAPLAAAVVESVKMGIAATQTEAKFDIAFGNMSKNARKWSNDLAAASHMDPYALRAQASTLELLFTQSGVEANKAVDMAEKLTQRAYDVSALTPGRDPKAALDALRGGLVGITRSLHNMGVVVSEGQFKQWALAHGISATEYATNAATRELVRFNVEMEATNRYAGAWEKIGKTPAGQLMQIREEMHGIAKEFGITLLPAMQDVLGFLQKDMIPGLRSTVHWFENLNNVEKGGVLAIGLGAGPLAIIAGQIMQWRANLAIIRGLESAAGGIGGIAGGAAAVTGLEATKIAADAATASVGRLSFALGMLLPSAANLAAGSMGNLTRATYADIIAEKLKIPVAEAEAFALAGIGTGAGIAALGVGGLALGAGAGLAMKALPAGAAAGAGAATTFDATVGGTAAGGIGAAVMGWLGRATIRGVPWYKVADRIAPYAVGAGGYEIARGTGESRKESLATGIATGLAYKFTGPYGQAAILAAEGIGWGVSHFYNNPMEARAQGPSYTDDQAARASSSSYMERAREYQRRALQALADGETDLANAYNMTAHTFVEAAKKQRQLDAKVKVPDPGDPVSTRPWMLMNQPERLGIKADKRAIAEAALFGYDIPTPVVTATRNKSDGINIHIPASFGSHLARGMSQRVRSARRSHV